MTHPSQLAPAMAVFRAELGRAVRAAGPQIAQVTAVLRAQLGQMGAAAALVDRPGTAGPGDRA